MNQIFKKALIFLGFGLPFVVIYKAFLLPGSLAWGDAPFFSPENLKELFNVPYLWNDRHDNFGSPQYYILWLYLPTYLYGLLNYALGLGNDLLIRIIFYFPATVLAIIGTWKFIGKFHQGTLGKFLGSFLYGFNTYFLMLLDGGQVGVALAYGLFPITLVNILGYVNNLSIKNFLHALATFFALVSVDIRIASIAVIFIGVIIAIEGVEEVRNKLSGLLILCLAVLGLCSYWIIPTMNGTFLSGLGNIGGLNSGNSFISLTNSLFLFQPHFPLNQFGKLTPTPFYFALLLPLIFGCLLFIEKVQNKKQVLKFTFVFLTLAFLAKGGSEPLGSLYLWFVNLPGGVAFRDSSKFYIPLLLTAALLLSFSINLSQQIVKQKSVENIIAGGIFVYLLFLIHPAVMGNLSGVLGEGRVSQAVNDYNKIAQSLSSDSNFARSLWFEEKPSRFYGTWEKPAISANNLYQDRPFASMIVGTYDLFNYLHSPQLCQWLDLLGMKYIFLPEPERKKIQGVKEQNFRQELLSAVSQTKCLSSVNQGLTFPSYQSFEHMPQLFAQKRAILVVGGEQVYDKLIENPRFSLKNQGVIFAEDGRTNINYLENLNPESLLILFEGKNFSDLQMAYLAETMLAPNQALIKQWKVYSTNNYLSWKYELLKNDIESKEFDYGKGVAISTIAGEKLNFKSPVSSKGINYLAIRFTNSLDGNLKVKALDNEYHLHNHQSGSFKWKILGPITIDQDNLEVEIVNGGKLALVNTLGVISEEEFNQSNRQTDQLLQRYKTIDSTKGLSDLSVLNDSPIRLDYQRINPTEYKIMNFPDYPVWLFFSDHYNVNWGINNQVAKTHLPFYASYNGFYLDGKSNSLLLSYLPQEQVKLSVVISLFSVGAVILIISLIFIKRKFKR